MVSEVCDYGTPGSFNIILTVISGTGLSGQKMVPVSITGTTNIEPTVAVSSSVDGMTLTLTDLTIDPDYACHPGDGEVYIDWGPGSYVIYPVTLTDSPSNQTFSYTYSSPYSGTIKYGVKDKYIVDHPTGFPVFIDPFSVTVP